MTMVSPAECGIVRSVNTVMGDFLADAEALLAASLHESLGLATVDTPLGIALKVDERRETSMPGIYAAGDLANPLMPSVTTASWQGAMAGIFAQQSMLV
jgi:thioredoxin reductase